MGLFGWLSKTAEKTPVEIATYELNVARQVAHIALQWHEKGVNLQEPEETLRSSPGILWTFEEEVIRAQQPVPGYIVWAHTFQRYGGCR